MNKEDLIIKIGLVFYIASIIGYFYELILTYFRTGKIFSHGYLFGPWLPIYGTGALFIMLISKFKKSPLAIFFLSFLLTGALEGITGFFLLKFLHMRLWDYTGYFLNINGFVCFLSAFCFAIGGILVTYVLCPLVEKLMHKVSVKKIKAFLSIISTFFIVDLIATHVK